jgi:ADP-ribose pyrophosphatase
LKKLIPSTAVLIPKQANKVFSGVIFDVYQWQQAMFDGSKATFEMLKRPDTVQIIALNNAGNIIVLNEEQPHSGKRLSLPGGRVDETDDSPLVAAKRELLEETGLSFKSWKLVGVKQPHAKIEWFIHTFLAWGELARKASNHDSGEKIQEEEYSFAEFKSLCLKKQGYLSEVLDIVERVDSISELQSLSEFSGVIVDR